eukprot:COSAG01_NODE_198_length_22280_cov_21.529775_1_plen_84_part_00
MADLTQHAKIRATPLPAAAAGSPGFLPTGVPETGVPTGVPETGVPTMRASCLLGVTLLLSCGLSAHGLNNSAALTPPMAWSSW